MTDKELVDELVNFVRTPEWSVSMLEDIADMVRKARPIPSLQPSFPEGDPRAWRPH